MLLLYNKTLYKMEAEENIEFSFANSLSVSQINILLFLSLIFKHLYDYNFEILCLGSDELI